MRLVVASGKGGTGKTTVAANLAAALSRSREVVAVDCVVEAPNLHLFFPSPAYEVPVRVPVPAVDPARCTLCGECERFCRFGAISVLPTGVFFLPDLCHSCGGCRYVCPEGAIRDDYRTVGSVRCARPSPGLTLIGGALGEGEVQAPAVVRHAKRLAGGAPDIIFDAPPGIGCTMIETMKGADACLLVTESTPFGAHDLMLAAEVARQLELPAGVVINRSDGQDRAIREVCRELGLPVLMTIPFDRSIAAVQNRGGLIGREHDGWHSRFAALFEGCAQRGRRGVIRLAVISGKGGTGKTVVTAGFAALNGQAERLADCDVEAANLELLLAARQVHATPFEGAATASIDPERCWGCSWCAELCRFGAITVHDDAVAVCEPRNCEGCGLCERVCPSGAVTLVPRISGTVLRSATAYGPLSHARLYPGAGNSRLLVRTVKRQAERAADEVDLLLIDGPPGTGGRLISTVSGTDGVVVVTEPSLSGLHDLRRVIRVCRRFDPRIFVVINRWDLDPGIANEIEAECNVLGVPVIGRIPFDPAVIEAVRAGRTISATDSPASRALAGCWAALRRELALA